jgi:hypothetical protein
VLGHIQGQLTNDYDEVTPDGRPRRGMLGSDDGYGVALKARTAATRASDARGPGDGRDRTSDSQSSLSVLLKDTTRT